jgi:hypothetical protein
MFPMFKTRPFLSRPVLLMASGSALLLTVSLFPSHSQSTTRADPPLKVAQLLDSVIQPRFEKDAGVFGLERLLILNGHRSLHEETNGLKPQGKQEIEILKRVTESHRDYLISFLHCAHVPGKSHPRTPGQTDPRPAPSKPEGEIKPSLTPLIWQGELTPYVTLEPANQTPEALAAAAGKLRERNTGIFKIATEALPALKQGKGAEKRLDDWFVAVRPILASKESCLGCHTGAKKGDLLGAVVYTIRAESYKDSTTAVRTGSLR